jgi:hypothetical protein
LCNQTGVLRSVPLKFCTVPAAEGRLASRLW